MGQVLHNHNWLRDHARGKANHAVDGMWWSGVQVVGATVLSVAEGAKLGQCWGSVGGSITALRSWLGLVRTGPRWRLRLRTSRH